MLRLCTKAYEAWGFSVTVERQNDFRLNLAGATISGRPDLVTSRDDETIIVDGKAAKPNPGQEIQVMLYMAWLPLTDGRYRQLKVSGQVYYAEDQGIDIPASAVDDRFRDIVKELISRLASKTPARKAPSANQYRFCPISTF